MDFTIQAFDFRKAGDAAGVSGSPAFELFRKRLQILLDLARVIPSPDLHLDAQAVLSAFFRRELDAPQLRFVFELGRGDGLQSDVFSQISLLISEVSFGAGEMQGSLNNDPFIRIPVERIGLVLRIMSIWKSYSEFI
jgi:hypothetical protein